MSIRLLPPELQVQAENELNEVPARIQEDLKHIREWLKKQPHLNVRAEDQWLLNFLRGCKFSLEITKKKLDMFYSMKTLAPEIFADRDPFSPKIQEILKLGMCFPLPKTLDGKSQPVLLMRHENVDVEQIHALDVIKVITMVLDILLNEQDALVIAGNQAINDFRSLSMIHMLQMTPSNCKKVFMCFQEAYPVRPKKVHFLNPPAFFDSLFTLIKPFMGEKLRNRIDMYSESNLKKLYSSIPRSVLPEEYGGEAGPVSKMAADWKKKVESYRDWFLEDAKYCSDESKRLGKPKTTADAFGVDGSFRKLNVD